MSSDDGKRLHSLKGRGSSSNELLFKALPAELRLSAAEKSELKQFVRLLGDLVAAEGSFNCLLTNDRELRRLNSYFLGHDFSTDVLSFPAAGNDGHLGEIAISLERAEAQASAFGHGRLDEVRILVLHGVLHLTGFDHEKDNGEMARAENKWRTVFGLPVPLLSRQRTARLARKQ